MSTMVYSVRRLGGKRRLMTITAKSVDDLWWIVDGRADDPSGYEYRAITHDPGVWTRFKFADDPVDGPLTKLIRRQKQRAALRTAGILK